jgi:hypothetical protein
MFSNVVVEHGLSNSTADVNVCWNEKTTQTGQQQLSGFNCELVVACSAGTHPSSISSNPSSPLSLVRKSSLKQQRGPNSPASNRTMDEQRPSSYSTVGCLTATTASTTTPQVPNGAGLTCQELLALSGALGAALPTPLALPNYPSVEEPQQQQSSSSSSLVATVTPTAASSKHSNNNKCNNQLLAPPPGLMPILPTLALSLWPEPFQGKNINNNKYQVD